MNSSKTDLAANASSQLLYEFFCPVRPKNMWDLSERIMFKTTAAITLVMCPITILLNIFVILAVRRDRMLKNSSNILLESLAVADVLIGAVSMPLTISINVLALRKQFFSPDVFCRIAFVKEMILGIGSTSSLYHLVVIAWERHVAITKWREYKVIVTKGRVKKNAIIVWLVAVLKSIPLRIMRLVGVQSKYMVVVNIVYFLPGIMCIILIIHFYIVVYFGVRKRNINTISEVRSLIKAKLASKVAKTTAILTGAVVISFLPTMALLFFGNAFSVLRRSSYFRWSTMMIHLNSVINPVLYCYRDRRYRDAC